MVTGVGTAGAGAGAGAETGGAEVGTMPANPAASAALRWVLVNASCVLAGEPPACAPPVPRTTFAARALRMTIAGVSQSAVNTWSFSLSK